MSTLPLETNIPQIPLQRPDGTFATLSDYLGQVVLVVNVASKCGLTPQYAGLESLYKEKREAGLTVLAFPAGNFRDQELDSDTEISAFCTLNYGVSFPIFSKISVAGADQHPLYAGLTHALPQALAADEFVTMMQKHNLHLASEPELLWNFEKFLISRQGEVVGRFAPHIGVEDPRLAQAIEAELAKA
ncbi:glutathione peroxidase [Glaciimonas immobilis]|uniref:Glutathione peroxidase n=1 Tax=Glaciimonas immobilis TaxID=728004 RepID=A0A840RX81_9BURK|nr:glutathione peroxidase [Glaciimonas immobilis]KAF3996149.1 glutathione peroxidase [Glaciimonas immobilis]MBB5201698.1 glutathione peroxidase [Glaciimonas immobilis]